MNKITNSSEFIGKRINVNGNETFENVELVAIEENGILVYDPEEKINYYIPKQSISFLDDNIEKE